MTTEKKQVARCAIYEARPKVCEEYPKVDHYIPPECTFVFVGNKREGSCACDVGACCATPREKGEPGGIPMPSVAGGEPCKHLVWEERDSEKIAAVSMGCSVGEPPPCSLCDLVGGPRDS